MGDKRRNRAGIGFFPYLFSGFQRGKDRGFTFFEILITVIFLSISLGILITFFTQSSRGTIDVYYETIALTLAMETIEWVANLGYENLNRKEVLEDIDRVIGVDVFREVAGFKMGPAEEYSYPEDYFVFERMVQIRNAPDGNPALKEVVVSVRTRESLIRSMFRRGTITLRRIVSAEYE